MKTDNSFDKLKQIHQFISTKPTQTNAISSRRLERLSRKLNGKLVNGNGGSYCLVSETYPFDFQLGDYQVSRDFTKNQIEFPSGKKNIDSHFLTPSNLLFIDTETTGLGGSGTVAFLIGVGSITEKGFEVRQYFLPDYGDESFMLDAIYDEISSDHTLVSYNGATFDLPLLRSRMVINKVAKDCKHKGHIDLLQHTRKIFKRRIKSCSLGNVEEELFQFYRDDDIPGFLVPSIYFDWLNNEDLDLMNKVMLHNRLDILSLFYLFDKLHNIYSSRGDVLDDIDDIHSLTRHYNLTGDKNYSTNLQNRILEKDFKEIPEDILFYQSINCKRSGDILQAKNIWNYISDIDNRCKISFSANIEIAKYFEHKERDYTKALVYTKKASLSTSINLSSTLELKKRIFRLNKKLKN